MKFLEAIEKLSVPEKAFAFWLREQSNDEGDVTVTWQAAFDYLNAKTKPSIRRMLTHMKQAGLGHGSTNDLIHFRFNRDLSLRVNDLSLRVNDQFSPDGNSPDAHSLREYAHSLRVNDHSLRVNAQFGGTIGGKNIHTYIDPVLKDFSLKENNLSIYVSSDESKSMIAMLTDELIAMPQKAAEVAAATTKPDRVLAIVAAYLAEVENGNGQHNAMGLFKRLTWREDGRYRFPAKSVPAQFYRTAFAARHGLEPPSVQTAADPFADLPEEIADIAIG